MSDIARVICFLLAVGAVTAAPVKGQFGGSGLRGSAYRSYLQKTMKNMEEQINRIDKKFTTELDSLKSRLHLEKNQRLKLESRLVKLERNIGKQNDQPAVRYTMDRDVDQDTGRINLGIGVDKPAGRINIGRALDKPNGRTNMDSAMHVPSGTTKFISAGDQDIGRISMGSGITVDDDSANETDEPNIVLDTSKTGWNMNNANRNCGFKTEIKKISTQLAEINRKLDRRGTAWASLGLPKLM